MSRIPVLPESDAVGKVEQTYGRIKDLLGVESLPTVMLQYGQQEAFLRDFYMNFKKFVWSDGVLDAKRKSLIAYAVACYTKCPPWMDLMADRAQSLGSSENELIEITALVATNAMYNTFFKFRELSGRDLFGGMPVGLRAHTFSGTSLDEQTVELINLVISDLNACRPCTSGHVDAARKSGLSDEQILEAVQCAATLNAACQFTLVAD